MRPEVREELLNFLNHAIEDFSKETEDGELGICWYLNWYYAGDMKWGSQRILVREKVNEFIQRKLIARAEELGVTDEGFRSYLFADYKPQCSLGLDDPSFYERANWLKKIKEEVENDV